MDSRDGHFKQKYYSIIAGYYSITIRKSHPSHAHTQRERNYSVFQSVR